MKAVLISGSYTKKEIANDIINFINLNITVEKNISFVASEFDKQEDNDRSVNNLLNEFEKKNLIFSNYYIIDSRYSKESMIDNITKSNIIFLLGGDTLEQIKKIKEYNLDKYIKDDNKIIIGISAGAINMAKRVVLAKDIEDNIPNLSIYEGIGITDINIEPHCDFYNKIHWQDLIEASMYTNLVVMHDDVYIIIDDNKINYYGHYINLCKGKIFFENKEIFLEDFIKVIK